MISDRRDLEIATVENIEYTCTIIASLNTLTLCIGKKSACKHFAAVISKVSFDSWAVG